MKNIKKILVLFLLTAALPLSAQQSTYKVYTPQSKSSVTSVGAGASAGAAGAVGAVSSGKYKNNGNGMVQPMGSSSSMPATNWRGEALSPVGAEHANRYYYYSAKPSDDELIQPTDTRRRTNGYPDIPFPDPIGELPVLLMLLLSAGYTRLRRKSKRNDGLME